MTECPACGSMDNLHMGPGKDEHGCELAHCFTPGCVIKDQHDLAAYLAGGVTVMRSVVAYEQPPAYPVSWWADHCGVPVSFVQTLPVVDYDGAVGFAFAGTDAVKTRPGEGDAPFGWNAEDKKRPPIWPVPADIVPPAMLLTEGEGDATTMAYLVARSGIDRVMTVHSVTKGADTVVPVRAWREYKRRGLEQVLVLFDEDGAGDVGAEKNLKTAREAGLEAVRVHLDGLDPLIGEKDARDLWLRRLTLPERDWDGRKVLCPYADQAMNLADFSLSELGAKVLAEVENVKSPDLIEGIIDPEGHTIVYGQGDVGKGVLASYVIARLTRLGHRVVIADFEDHPNEWRRRIEGFGGDFSLVAIVHPTKPLWDVADDLRAIRRAFGAEFVVIDSISTATSGQENPYSPDTPVKYHEALRRVGGHALSLAHVTKANPNPEYPFGAIGWHHQARTTWSLADVDGKKVLEHRKQGNRAWQGKHDVDIEFHDDTGLIDISITRRLGAVPTVQVTGKAQRVEKLAVVARNAAPQVVTDAVSRNFLCGLMGKGAKDEKLDGITLALARGWVAETPEKRVWSGDGPRSNAVQSGPLDRVDHDRSAVNGVLDPVTGGGPTVQSVDTVDRGPLLIPTAIGQRGES